MIRPNHPNPIGSSGLPFGFYEQWVDLQILPGNQVYLLGAMDLLLLEANG